MDEQFNGLSEHDVLNAHPQAAHRESEHAKASDTSLASEVWLAARGAARVGKELAIGAVGQVIAHPLETAAEVAAGVVVAGVIAEAAIPTSAALVVAAVPIAAYAFGKGIQVASTEGLSAIPTHIKLAAASFSNEMATLSSAFSTVYKGDTGPDLLEAKASVESIGALSVPFAAGILGGASRELGSQIVRQTAAIGSEFAQSAERALWGNTLNLQPAYVYGPESMVPVDLIAAKSRLSAIPLAIEGATVTEMRGMEFGDKRLKKHFEQLEHREKRRFGEGLSSTKTAVTKTTPDEKSPGSSNSTRTDEERKQRAYDGLRQLVQRRDVRAGETAPPTDDERKARLSERAKEAFRKARRQPVTRLETSEDG